VRIEREGRAMVGGCVKELTSQNKRNGGGETGKRAGQVPRQEMVRGAGGVIEGTE